jgi:hypothetical protein
MDRMFLLPRQSFEEYISIMEWLNEHDVPYARNPWRTNSIFLFRDEDATAMSLRFRVFEDDPTDDEMRYGEAIANVRVFRVHDE